MSVISKFVLPQSSEASHNLTDTKQAQVLVNENGIWEDEQYLAYMRQVDYTFNEPGVYAFYLKGREDKKKQNVTVV